VADRPAEEAEEAVEEDAESFSLPFPLVQPEQRGLRYELKTEDIWPDKVPLETS
jgi:hypothetical protein